MKIAAYYIAIVMLILFVGVVIFRLLFGSPCTMVGNNCVGDGWTIAGLAATILGVTAAILGILGAFAVAAWWTGLDERVGKQVDTTLKQQEEILNKRVDSILIQQEARVDRHIQEDLTRFSERVARDFSESEQVVKALYAEIKLLRNEYGDVKNMAEDARKISVDAVTFGRPWNIEPLAMNAVHEYHMIDVAVKMVHKYLEYVDGFLSRTAGEKGQYMSSLLQSGAPSASFQYFWDSVLHWADEVNSFSSEHPEVVKQINDQVESYNKRINDVRQNIAQ